MMLVPQSLQNALANADAPEVSESLEQAALTPVGFKPIDPSNPSFTDPGGHERLPVIENPGRAAPAKQTIIPPSSPAVQAAIARLQKWLPINERNGPNHVMRKNLEILQRGGPIAEAVAKHTLDTWKEFPERSLEPPTIEGTRSE